MPSCGSIAPVAADELEFDAEDLTALLDLHVDDLGRGRAIVLGERRAGGDDRARFRHAPGVQQEDAQQIVELLDRGARRRRAAGEDVLELELLEIEALAVGFDPGEEIEPDRRNAAGLGAFLLLEQHVNAFGIEPRSGKDHLGPAHRRRKRQAPGVGVKERHDDEKGVARRQRKTVGSAGGERVQHRRAVAVHHPLRIAGRAGRVAQRRGGVLVEERPLVIGRRLRHEVFVAERRKAVDRRHRLRLAQRDPAAHQRQPRLELLDQRREDRIEADDGVFGVMHDVLDLVREEPRVDGMQHPPRAGHSVIEFEVAIAVPRERRDAIAAAEAERVERVRDPLRAGRDLRVIRTMKCAFRIAGDDLASAVPGRGIIDQAGYEKRTVLHQSKHDRLPWPPRASSMTCFARDARAAATGHAKFNSSLSIPRLLATRRRGHDYFALPRGRRSLS